MRRFKKNLNPILKKLKEIKPETKSAKNRGYAASQKPRHVIKTENDPKV